MYKIEDRVIIIDRNNESGTIKSINKYGPLTYIGVMLDSNVFVTTIANNIRAKIDNPSPLDLMKQANFQSKEVYIVGGVINKMFGNSNDIIATLKSSKTTFLPYQFKPLNKFLKSDNRRILIADEVGLGKTIEAGYILAELSLRGQIKNCLIICKSSLKEKWQTELKNKFAFDFKIQSRKELITSVKDDIKNGTESIYSIINYDYNKKGSDEFTQLVETTEYLFDMLIVDEAHILRNESTIKHGAVKKLINMSKNVVLLTATPIMTSLTNLFSLVRIIEPRYDSYSYGSQDFGYSLFMDHLALSSPFIEAINNLNKGVKPKVVINELMNKEVSLRFSLLDGSYSYASSVKLADRFSKDPLFESTIKMADKESFTYADLALLQKRLSELNSFQDIITRTRRREIQVDVQKVTRNAKKIKVNLTPLERDFYESVINDYEGEPLVLVQKKRQITSCLPAYIEKHNLINDDFHEIIRNDSKFKALEQIVNDVVKLNDKKLIIFSFFKGTLKYLERRFQHIGINTLKIDGDIPITERQSVIDNFEKESLFKILLSSEVGSEGLDMQFCDVLVNYDLPWNPMVVEQRIGRIDRIGQKSSVIHIFNLCISDTIEEQIFERLLDRIQIFKESIGNLEDILSSDGSIFEANEGLEAEIYGKRLTKKALEEKIRDIEIALETAELMRKDIEDNLDESFLNDQYISDEISTINKQKRYITSDDIKSLINLLFQTRLATLRCDLEATSPYIRWDYGDDSIFDFISQNIPSRKENPQLYNNYLQFKTRNNKKEILECTFNQDEAFNNKLIEFISPTHPLSQAAFRYFKTENTIKNNAFFFCIDEINVPDSLPKDLIYILARYNMESLKYTMAKTDPDKSFFELQLLFSLNEEGEFLLISEDETNQLLGIDNRYWYINSNEIPYQEECSDIIDLFTPVLMHNFYLKKCELENDLKNVHSSRQYRLIDTEIDFLNRQIERDNKTLLEDPENAIRFIFQKRIEQYQNKIIELENQRSKIKLELHEALQSISIIKVI